jgi:hypothetical protein
VISGREEEKFGLMHLGDKGDDEQEEQVAGTKANGLRAKPANRKIFE